MYHKIYLLAIICAVQGGTINKDLEEQCLRNPKMKVYVMFDFPPVNVSVPSVVTDEGVTRHVADLQRATGKIQAPILAEIYKVDPTVNVLCFWIANKCAVQNISCEDILILSKSLRDVFIRREEVISLPPITKPDSKPPEPTSVAPKLIDLMLTDPKVNCSGSYICDVGDVKGNTSSCTYGVSKTNAPQVWCQNSTNGTGIVVSHIDTGVRYTHEALNCNFRGGYFGWLDGCTNSSLGKPVDQNGHGTHTMATICGQKNIGMAPGAKWITCRGCACNGTGTCTETNLTTCAQWNHCPYYIFENGTVISNCSMRPRVVSNSWASSGLLLISLNPSTFFDPFFKLWESSNIISTFAIGNNGPLCLTAQYPGISNYTIGVGATTANDSLASFSSRGPYSAMKLNVTQPDISAPGDGIYSAWNNSDTAYVNASGTSMACPHVAGAVALMLSKNASLTFSDVFKCLTSYAFRPVINPTDVVCSCPTNVTCSLVQQKEYPNNGYGYGRIDIFATFLNCLALIPRSIIL